MKQLCADLAGEQRELATLLETLTPPQWRMRMPFLDWSAWDELAHLAFFDEAALLALRDAPEFEAHAAERTRQDLSNVVSGRDGYAGMSGPQLLRHWHAVHAHLVAQLSARAPDSRLPWYGAAMSARSFATARLMEVWAHGQDVWDALRMHRPGSARLQHICHLGCATFHWAFKNRGLSLPARRPQVMLQAPCGSVWTWGDAQAGASITGPAQDFCLVVTQRRHVDDTALACHGEAARAWMLIAQCFAGPPANGPAPGVRAWNR